jgi:hypothetical protein
MKRILPTACFLFATLVTARPAEAPIDPQVAALIKEVHLQQTAIAENQAKIDEKLAAVTEAIRVARIYSSRSGK